MKRVCCSGDPASHPGSIITTNDDDTLTVGVLPICANQALFSCDIPFHGVTPITAITVRSFVNGKLILTEGAQAGCGAVMQPPDRKVYVE